MELALSSDDLAKFDAAIFAGYRAAAIRILRTVASLEVPDAALAIDIRENRLRELHPDYFAPRLEPLIDPQPGTISRLERLVWAKEHRATLTDDQVTAPLDLAIENLNWTLLEADESTLSRIVQHLTERQGRSRKLVVDESRLTFIQKQGPDRLALGLGEFDGYLAYIFERYGKAVLENAREGNAVYVFGDDWKELSRMSKTSLMHSSVKHERIVHNGDWKGRLIDALLK